MTGTRPVASAWPSLPRYRVLRHLGRGGQADVFLGEHLELGRQVAIKVLREESLGDDGDTRRFLREARTMVSLRHSNIIDVLDAGETLSAPRRPFFAMELMDSTLHGWGDTASTKEVLAIVVQVLRGLAGVHRRDKVHRDIKPSNCLVRFEDGALIVKVGDFGIVRSVAPSPEDPSTQGAVLGTPHYMSPEQIEGQITLDARSDLYSVGVMLFQLLTGRLPFTGPTTQIILIQHLTKPPPSLRAASPGSEFSEALETLVRTVLAKSRDDRFPNAEAFRAAIEALPEFGCPTPAPAPSAPTPPAAAAPVPSHRSLRILTIALAGILLIIAALLLDRSQRPAPELWVLPSRPASTEPPAVRAAAELPLPTAPSPPRPTEEPRTGVRSTTPTPDETTQPSASDTVPPLRRASERIAPREVQRRLESLQSSVQNCHEKFGWGRELTVDVKVGPNGQVQHTRVTQQNTLKLQELERCVRRVVSALRFAETVKGGAGAVVYKFD